MLTHGFFPTPKVSELYHWLTALFLSAQLSSGQGVRIFLVLSGHQWSKAFSIFVALLLHLCLVMLPEIQAGTAPGQAVDGTNVQQLQYAQKQL